MVLEFVNLFLVGSVIGSVLVRFLYRLMVGAKVTNIKVNLSKSTNRKFRIIELVPFLGTTLTHYKHKDENVNVAKYAFGMELLSGLSFYLGIKLTSTLMMHGFIVFWVLVLVGYIFYHIVADVEDAHIEKEDFWLIKPNKEVTQPSLTVITNPRPQRPHAMRRVSMTPLKNNNNN